MMHIYALTRYMYKGYKNTRRKTQTMKWPVVMYPFLMRTQRDRDLWLLSLQSLLDSNLTTTHTKKHHNTKTCVHACCTASREALCVLISAHQNDKCTRRIELHIMQPHLDRLKKTEYEVMDLPVSTQRYLNTLFMLYDWIILYFSLLNEVQLAETGVF